MDSSESQQQTEMKDTLRGLETGTTIECVEAEFCTYYNFTIHEQNTRDTGERELIEHTSENENHIIVIPETTLPVMLISVSSDDGAIQNHHGSIGKIKC